MMYRQTPTFSPNEILVYLRKSRADDPSMTVEEVLKKMESPKIKAILTVECQRIETPTRESFIKNMETII